MTRRWKEDGDDHYTGNQGIDDKGRSKGPGGFVSWHIHGKKLKGRCYMAHAWTKTEEWEREYRTVETAKKAIERWLAKRVFTR